MLLCMPQDGYSLYSIFDLIKRLLDDGTFSYLGRLGKVMLYFLFLMITY